MFFLSTRICESVFRAEKPCKDAVEPADDALEEALVYLTAPVAHVRVGLRLRVVRLTGVVGLYRQDYCGCVFSRRHDLQLKK